MRSIGKVNIEKLNKIMDEEFKPNLLGRLDFNFIRENIEKRVPCHWFDSWESAYNEIERLIDDGITERMYKK